MERLGEEGALKKARIKDEKKGKFGLGFTKKATIKGFVKGNSKQDIMKKTNGYFEEGRIGGKKDFEVKGFWGRGRPMQAC